MREPTSGSAYKITELLQHDLTFSYLQTAFIYLVWNSFTVERLRRYNTQFLVRLHFTFPVEGVVEISQNKAILFFTHSAFTNKSMLQRINAIWLHHSCSIIQFCVQRVTRYQSWWKLLANFLSTWQLEEFHIFLWQTGPILPTHTFISSYIRFSNELSAGSVIRQEICMNMTW